MIQGDKDLMRIISDAGTDLSRTREIGHFCYFDTQQAADAAAASLRARGEFDIEVYKTDLWVLRASQQAVLSEDYITEMRPAFTTFAEAFGGRYDGWDADADQEPGDEMLLS